MRYFITAIFINLVTISQLLFAQAPDTMWTKTLGGSGHEAGYSVQQTSDGGYIITGTISSSGNDDVWLIKTDADGDTLWTKTFGDNGAYDEGHSVRQTTDEGYIITGVTKMRSGNPYPYRGGEIWLIKTNATGDTLWSKTFSRSQSGNDIGYSIQQTTDGGYILTGTIGRILPEIYFGDPLGGDIFLIKTDVNGDTLWTNIFGGNDTSYVYGDVGYSVQQTTDGGYIISGFTDTFVANDIDIWLIKTDVNGDTMWTRTFSDGGWDRGYSVQQTNDSGYIIVATGPKLLKTDVNGDTMWTRTYGNDLIGGSLYSSGYSVQQTSDEGYVVLGPGTGLIKTDVNGDTMWTRTFEGTGHSVQQTSDGGYIVAGIRNGDVLLIKIAPDVTSIDGNPQTIIVDYHLLQNYPNPFNPSTNIEFSIPTFEFVTLKVYNILGEEVATLVSERLAAGSYKYDWDAGELASGLYMYRLKAGDFAENRKMILMK